MGASQGADSEHISIHALLAESDLLTLSMVVILILFLSTLSLRRATFACAGRLQIVYNFYPRSPCGERPGSLTILGGFAVDFYPRSPCGERRWLRCWKLAARDISIHALLAESDSRLFTRIA